MLMLSIHFQLSYPLLLKGNVCINYVRPAILCGCEVWSLKVNEMGILQKTVVTSMCGVQLKDSKRSKTLILTLGFNEAIDQLTMANILHVLMMEDC